MIVEKLRVAVVDRITRGDTRNAIAERSGLRWEVIQKIVNGDMTDTKMSRLEKLASAIGMRIELVEDNPINGKQIT